MEERQKIVKKPIPKETIFKIMLYATFIVASLFLVKNIVGKSLQGVLVIGISLAVFAAALILMKVMNSREEVRQFVVSMSLVFLVFIISLNSGESYSDDFSLYLAVIGLTGLYLRPKYTLIQSVLADILLVMQYLLHPEKGENLSQFILCMATFTLAACMFYQAIRRGRAFIEISQARAEQAEKLLDSLATIGEELEHNFKHSSAQIESMKEANHQLEGNAEELRTGSTGITQGAKEVACTCEDVQDKMQITENHIEALNNEVRTFEDALALNRKNMQEMSHQMESVKKTMHETNGVFKIMDEQMKEIFEATGQLNSISANTTMLALNASIEAARAGQMGAGFAVVASKVQELAVDSNKCSGQVAAVVGQMQTQIEKTTEQLEDSTQAINSSLAALEDLQGGFEQLTEQFSSLYGNIEEQNSNVNEVDAIFDQLKGKISEMNSYSEENQCAVESITEAMEVYKNTMEQVLDDTRHVHELSASMIELSRENRERE